MKKIVILLIIPFLLTSCGVFKKYTRPDFQTDHLYGEHNSSNDTTTLATLSWREIFTEPELQQLIDTALAYNVELKISQLRIDEATAALKTARLAFVPSFFFNPEGAYAYTPSQREYTYNIPITMSWEVDLFGKLYNAKEKAKIAYRQSEEYKKLIQTQIIANSANVYYTLVMLDEQLRITEATVDVWRENLRIMNAMKDAGMANETAVSQTAATFHSIETAVFDIKQAIRETENALTLIVGKPLNHINRGHYSTLSFPSSLTIGIPLQLLSNRPDVKCAEMSLMQSHYGINEAKAAFYPSIVLGGTAGWTNDLGTIIIHPGTWLLSAFGSLTEPIFNSGRNMAQLKIAKAEYEVSILNFQQCLLFAGTEVNTALSQCQTARAKVISRNAQIESLGKAVHNTELMMNNANTTYLDVLIARQSLLQAQIQQTEDWLQEAQGVVNLYKALGGGTK